MTQRICITCREAKPATEEFFHRAPTNRDGLRRQCRTCRAEWAAAYRAANRAKVRAQNKAAEARARDVGDDICSVESCAEPVYRRPQPYCGAHYARWRKYGDPLGTFTSRAADITRQQFGMLTVVRQDGNRWLVRCECGVEKRVEAGNLRSGSIKSCGNHRRSEDVTYGGVHQRVKRDRGLPDTHRCIDCDGQAMDWSYDHEDPDELISPKGMPFSTHIENYQPRCRPCHRLFDNAYVNQTKG